MSRLYSTYTRLFDIGAASHHLQKSRKKTHILCEIVFDTTNSEYSCIGCLFDRHLYVRSLHCGIMLAMSARNLNRESKITKTHTHERKNRSFHCKTEWNAFDDRHATDTHRQTNAHIEVCTWSLIWGDKIMNANNYHFHTHLHKMKKKEREKMYV